MSLSRRKSKIAMAVAATLAVSATAAYAAGLDADAVNLHSAWTNGGEAWLELEDRNVKPVICFIWTNDAPQDGDSITSRILTASGTPVLDLGTGDQWLEGTSSGCEVPVDSSYRDVFVNPAKYVVEVRVVDNQGSAVTSPLRSQPLRAAEG